MTWFKKKRAYLHDMNGCADIFVLLRVDKQRLRAAQANQRTLLFTLSQLISCQQENPTTSVTPQPGPTLEKLIRTSQIIRIGEQYWPRLSDGKERGYASEKKRREDGSVARLTQFLRGSYGPLLSLKWRSVVVTAAVHHGKCNVKWLVVKIACVKTTTHSIAINSLSCRL